MPDVHSMLEIDDNNVRKWGNQLFFLQAPDAPVPEKFFGEEDRLPILPPDALQLGYITTDGISNEESLSSEPSQMLQNLEPTRTDLTGIERSLTVAFGEDNAWVQALWHGKPFEEFAERGDGPWLFDDGALSEYPYYRLGWIGQDGIGSLARYRVEYGYRAKVTAKESRSANRSDPESYGFTFGLFRDSSVNKAFTRAQNGPAYATSGSGGSGGSGDPED